MLPTIQSLLEFWPTILESIKNILELCFVSISDLSRQLNQFLLEEYWKR